MSAEEDAPHTTPEPTPHVPLLKPGYFECGKILERLHRFQDLVRHHQRRGTQLSLARPLEKLLPSGAPEGYRYEVIEQEINRLVPLVGSALYHAEIWTLISWPTQETEYDGDKLIQKKVDRRFDLVEDYFQIPRTSDAAAFNLLMSAIERGIGVYEEYRRRALWDFINPLAWTAFLIRMPLIVLEKAGLYDEDARSYVLRVYGWLIRSLMFFFIVFGIAKLGIAIPIPWDKLIGIFLK